MINITLTNFKLEIDKIKFDCLDYEIDKSCYVFWISSTQKTIIPMYDWILDAVYPFEQKWEKKK